MVPLKQSHLEKHECRNAVSLLEIKNTAGSFNVTFLCQRVADAIQIKLFYLPIT